MGFWDDLEKDLEENKVNLDELAANGGNIVLPQKDYYCKVDSWKFDVSSQKGTPGVMAVLKVVAPCDGIGINEVAGKNIYVNMWLSEKCIGRTMNNMSSMSGEKVSSLDDMKDSQINKCVFKLAKNKIEEYDNKPKFVAGFINSMSKTDYETLDNMGVSYDGNDIDNSKDNTSGIDDDDIAY